MTPAGWIIMISSVSAVTLLFVWCLYRVLSHTPPVEPFHGIDDIKTHDNETE